MFPRNVAQDNDRLIDMVDNDVGPTVVVEIGDGEAAAAVLGLEVRPALGRDVREFAVAFVFEQDWKLGPGAAGRMADDMAVGKDEVLPAVVVEIDEAGAETDVFRADGGDAGRRRGVQKGSALARVAV